MCPNPVSGWTRIRNIYYSIAGTYQDDFSKYAKHKDLALMQKVFRQIPIYMVEELPRILGEIRKAPLVA